MRSIFKTIRLYIHTFYPIIIILFFLLAVLIRKPQILENFEEKCFLWRLTESRKICWNMPSLCDLPEIIIKRIVTLMLPIWCDLKCWIHNLQQLHFLGFKTSVTFGECCECFFSEWHVFRMCVKYIEKLATGMSNMRRDVRCSFDYWHFPFPKTLSTCQISAGF